MINEVVVVVVIGVSTLLYHNVIDGNAWSWSRLIDNKNNGWQLSQQVMNRNPENVEAQR
jgi:hypothetical protein